MFFRAFSICFNRCFKFIFVFIIFQFNKSIFDYLSADEDCDLEIGPLEKIAGEGQLIVYKHRGTWACMDTIRDMEYLNKLWAEGKAEWKVWK